MGLGQVLEVLNVLLEGGVVHQHVKAAELLCGSGHSLLAEFRIGYITRNDNAVAPFLLDSFLGFFGIVMLIEIGDGDIGSLARKQNGYRAPDAGIAARNEGDFAVELLGALVMRGVTHRRELKFGFLARLAKMLLGKWRLGV